MALPLGSHGRIDIDDFNVTGNCDVILFIVFQCSDFNDKLFTSS